MAVDGLAFGFPWFTTNLGYQLQKKDKTPMSVMHVSPPVLLVWWLEGIMGDRIGKS